MLDFNFLTDKKNLLASLLFFLSGNMAVAQMTPAPDYTSLPMGLIDINTQTLTQPYHYHLSPQIRTVFDFALSQNLRTEKGQTFLSISRIKELNIPYRDIVTPTLTYTQSLAYLPNRSAEQTDHEGLQLEVQSTAEASRKFSHLQYLGAAYHQKAFSIYGTLHYGSIDRVTTEDITRSTDDDNPYHFFSRNNLKADPLKTKDLSYTLGIDFRPNASNTFALNWFQGKTDIHHNGLSTNKTRNLRDIIDDFQNTYYINDDAQRKHLNATYSYTAGDKLKISLAADYATVDRDHRWLSIEQTTSDNYIIKSQVTDWRARQQLISVSPSILYSIGKHVVLHLGAQADRIQNTDRMQHALNEDTLRSRLQEMTTAAYVGVQMTFNPVRLTIGTRYEKDHFSYEQGEATAKRSKNHILPYASLSCRLGETEHLLIYRQEIIRPTLEMLGGYSHYLHRYERREGNPVLTAAHVSDISYGMQWRDLSFSARYSEIRDPFVPLSALNSQTRKGYLISSWFNIPRQNDLTLTLRYAPDFGWYKPACTIAYIDQTSRMETAAGHISTLHKPMPYASVQNTFLTPWFDARLDYEYTGKGCLGVFLTKPKHVLSMGLSKRCLNDALSITLYWNDILGQDITHHSTWYKGVLYTQKVDHNRSAIGLSIAYKLNGSITRPMINTCNQLYRLR